jgi:transcriptional regulator with XRE-family HTH domain
VITATETRKKRQITRTEFVRLRHDFGERLKFFRQAKQLTLAQLGEACNLSATHVCHFESGRRMPRFDILIRLIHALGISLVEFESL